MLKILFWLLLVCAAMIVGPSLADKQGFVHISVGNYIIEASVTTTVVLALITIVVVHVLWNFINSLLHVPGGTARYFKRRHEKKALSRQDLAYIAYAKGDFKKALDLISKSGPLKELPINALLVSAKSAFNVGNFDYCRKALDEAAKRGPECKAATTIIRAKLNLKVNNTKAALEYLDSLNGSCRNTLIYKLYYDCYKANTDIEKIYGVASNLVKGKVLTEDNCREIFCNYFEERLQKAQTFEDMENVYKILNKQDRYNSQFIAPYIHKLLSLNLLDKAKSLSLSFLKHNDDPEFLESISKWDIAMPEVLKALQKMAARNALSADSNLHLIKALANLELKQGLLQEALENYKKALKLSQTPDIYAKIGQILSMQQNYTEATEYFSKSYALTENTAASKVVAKDEEKKEEIPEAEIIETPLKKE
jgi:HemY protein